MKIPALICGFFFLSFYKDLQPRFFSIPATKHFTPGVQIVWDYGSLKKISATGTAFYPRMLQLKNGSLLAVYASNGGITGTKSRDGGKTWAAPVVIAEKSEGINRDTPDLLQLQDGALLICYGSRPQGAMKGAPEGDKKFDIRIKKSYDNGVTWGFEKVLYEAGSLAKDGCWEPAAVQLPSGELQLFFANEGIYGETAEQNISLLRSFDGGKTWSANPQIISFRKESRDGMPVPLWLDKRNEVVLAIEDPGAKNFKPYIIRSAAGGAWKNIVGATHKNREYALTDKLEDSIYAGAPYLKQLSTGETILSYQSTEGRKVNKDHNAAMIVAIGDKEGKNFGNKTVPFAVPEGRHALWNSLCVLKGDTLVAVTSTNAFSGSGSEVWMIKGILKR